MFNEGNFWALQNEVIILLIKLEVCYLVVSIYKYFIYCIVIKEHDLKQMIKKLHLIINLYTQWFTKGTQLFLLYF